MRLWSLHPRYLDAKGLVAVWREGLLAQAVLTDRTRGYRNHPQLARFKAAATPAAYIAAYLRGIHTEAHGRGYRFDERRIARAHGVEPLAVTAGQMDHEWLHLQGKLASRDPARWVRFEGDEAIDPHPLFWIVPGAIAEWEIVAPRDRDRSGVAALQPGAPPGPTGGDHRLAGH